MTGTYTAVEVSEPGTLQVVQRPLPNPAAGQVRIRVEACGVCHTDAATVTGTYPGLTLPRVPGHEVVGRIDALGSSVSRWRVSQRVGVGFFGGEDGVCEPCRRGDIVNCRNPGDSWNHRGWWLCRSDDRRIAWTCLCPGRPHVGRSGPSPVRGNHDLQRPAERRPAQWRSGRRSRHWRPWASRYPVCAAHGIPSGRTRAGTREGQARTRSGRRAFAMKNAGQPSAQRRRSTGAQDDPRTAESRLPRRTSLRLHRAVRHDRQIFRPWLIREAAEMACY